MMWHLIEHVVCQLVTKAAYKGALLASAIATKNLSTLLVCYSNYRYNNFCHTYTVRFLNLLVNAGVLAQQAGAHGLKAGLLLFYPLLLY